MHKALIVILIPWFYYAPAQQKKLSAEDCYNLAVASMNKGNLNDARNWLDRAIYENPVYADAYATRAIIRERLDDLQGALMDYTLSLEIQPNQFEVLLSRGALNFEMKRFEQARDDFTKLLTLPAGETTTIFYRQSAHSPGTDQILTAQGNVRSQVFNYLGLVSTELKNCKEAITWFDSAIYLDNEADYYVNRALARQACDDSKASDDFRHALKLNPYHAIAKHNLALVSSKQGSTDIESQLSEAIALDSMMLEPYLERAYYRLSIRNYKGALEDYNRALTLERNDPEIWLNRGLVNEKLKDYKSAYADYTQAIQIKNNFTMAWLNRGNLLALQNRYAEAIEDYSVAITYEPDYASAYYNRAIAYYKSTNKSVACANIQMAKRLGLTVVDEMLKQFCGSE